MYESFSKWGAKMKRFKVTVAVLGMTLCVAACNKTRTTNSSEDNSMNAATPEAATPEANAAAENAATENNVAVPENAANNGERTDTGPRGNPNG
jgi:uncharacterized lipoprotein